MVSACTLESDGSPAGGAGHDARVRCVWRLGLRVLAVPDLARLETCYAGYVAQGGFPFLCGATSM